MDGAAILFILAIAGVAAIFLFSVKGVLDQLPDVIDSAGNVRDAWDRFKKKGDSSPEPDKLPPPAQDEPEAPPRTDGQEPPAAA